MKTNIKMQVNPEQSRKVQEIVFANGGMWSGTSKTVRYTEAPFLYLKEGSNLTYGETKKEYQESPEEAVNVDLFIRTNGTCEEAASANKTENYLTQFKGYVYEMKDFTLFQACDHYFEGTDTEQQLTVKVEKDGFVCFKTEAIGWSLDFDEIDSFCAWLKGLEIK